MPCYSPIRLKNPLYGSRDKESLYKHREKYRGSLSFVKESLNGMRQFIDVPCGKCFGCMRMRCNGWVFKHLLELKSCTSAHFVTLTYDDDHIPINDDGSLAFSKIDCQLFLKRLRKWLSVHYPSVRIKYHLAAEYGDTFGRPHYHMLLYNFPPVDKALDQIPISWDKGKVDIGDVTEASIRYVVEYITQFYYKHEFPNENEKPFALFSKSLGVDYAMDVAQYLNASSTNLYPVNGKQYRVPNSYLQQLVDKGLLTPFKLSLIKQNAQEYYEQNSEKLRQNLENRGMDIYDYQRATFIAGKERNERKYQLRKNQ